MVEVEVEWSGQAHQRVDWEPPALRLSPFKA
jgi:hypothetical protein